MSRRSGTCAPCAFLTLKGTLCDGPPRTAGLASLALITVSRVLPAATTAGSESGRQMDLQGCGGLVTTIPPTSPRQRSGDRRELGGNAVASMHDLWLCRVGGNHGDGDPQTRSPATRRRQPTINLIAGLIDRAATHGRIEKQRWPAPAIAPDHRSLADTRGASVGRMGICEGSSYPRKAGQQPRSGYRGRITQPGVAPTTP
jgi:hypothetical protein